MNEEQTPNNQPSAAKKSYIGLAFGTVVLILVIIGVVALVHHKNNHNNATNVSATVPAAAKVSINKTGFFPATISIKVGQAVDWTNQDTANHEVASDPYPTDNGLAGFDTKMPLTPGQSYIFIFKRAGTFTYHDNLYPYTLKGTVIVK